MQNQFMGKVEAGLRKTWEVRIRLKEKSKSGNKGDVVNDGTVEDASRSRGQQGGEIRVAGKAVEFFGQGRFDISKVAQSLKAMVKPYRVNEGYLAVDAHMYRA